MNMPRPSFTLVSIFLVAMSATSILLSIFVNTRLIGPAMAVTGAAAFGIVSFFLFCRKVDQQTEIKSVSSPKPPKDAC